jgi:sugar lactone lactonase YvrE
MAVPASALPGESPLWHPDEQVLCPCDTPGTGLHRFDPASGLLARWDSDCEVAGCPLLPGGELLLAMRDGLRRFRTDHASSTLLVEPPRDTRQERFDAGKCNPQRRSCVSTVYEPRGPALASPHSFSAGRLRRKAEGVAVSIGLV